MKGYCLFLILLLATIMSAAQRAQDPTDTAQRIKGSTNTVQRAQISLETGYQSMDFRWSIAGNMNGTGPNVYSELIWKQVKGPALNAAVQWKLGKRLCLSGSYNHVFTQSGNVSDKDYQADNRTEETYQGNFSSGRGYSEYWSAAIGYTIVDNRLVSLVPFIGYGASDQSLYLLDDSPETGALNSSYKAHWYGPLVKVRSTLHLTGRLGVGLDVVYHQVDYRAKADWNLIETFQHPVSFSHTAEGFGVNGNIRLNYRLTQWVTATVGAGYFDWQTGRGIDQLYLVNGQTDKTRMNGAISRGWGSTAGVNISF